MGKIFDSGGDFSGRIVGLEPHRDGMLVTIRQDADSTDKTYTQEELVGIFVTNDCIRFPHEFSLSQSGRLVVVKCKH